MATLIGPLALSGSRKADGTVNAGGRVFLTRPGTANTRVTGYRDKDKSAAHTLSSGGYLLDAAGKIDVFIDEPATVRVEDSSGVAVDSFSAEPTVSAGLVEVISDGFTGVDAETGQYAAGERTYLARVLNSIATSVGGVDGMFLAAAGATNRTIQSKFIEVFISVKDYGAVGDGVADDTIPIQNAANRAIAIGIGSVVFFPPGTYKITQTITASSGVTFLGAGPTIGGAAPASTIKNASTTGNSFTLSSSGNAFVFRNLRINTTTTSSGAAISHTGSILFVEDTSISGHLTGITGGVLYMNRAVVSGGTSGTGVVTSGAIVVASSLAAVTGTALSINDNLGATPSYLVGTQFTAGTIGVDTSASGTIYAAGCDSSVPTTGLRTATGSGAVRSSGCNWGTVNDRRTGAPIAYSVGTTSSVTPLPAQTDTVRINATAGGITVTIGAALAAVHGHMLTLICINSSGGAVTWTFNAQYKTSASVAPSTGNGIAVIFQYDAISSVYREITRGAAVAI